METKVNPMDCTAQSPDLNPETRVHGRRPSNLEELGFLRRWVRLSTNLNKRLQAVIQQKGETIDC